MSASQEASAETQRAVTTAERFAALANQSIAEFYRKLGLQAGEPPHDSWIERGGFSSGPILDHIQAKAGPLNYLIIGDKPTKRKVDSANQLKIKILPQEQFLDMLNKTS